MCEIIHCFHMHALLNALEIKYLEGLLLIRYASNVQTIQERGHSCCYILLAYSSFLNDEGDFSLCAILSLDLPILVQYSSSTCNSESINLIAMGLIFYCLCLAFIGPSESTGFTGRWLV